MIKESIYFAALYGLTYAKVQEGRYDDCQATLCDRRYGECVTVRQEDIDQEIINYSWGELTMGWGNSVLTSRDIRAQVGNEKYDLFYDYYNKQGTNLR